MLTVNSGIGLILLGILLYVLGVVIPLGILLTLGVILGVVGLVVLAFSFFTGTRGRRSRL